MYDDVKIELKNAKKTIDRLKYVAAKGRIRTLQRIRQAQEEEELRELEKTLVSEATKAATQEDETQVIGAELTTNEKRALALAKARAAKAAKNAK